MRPFTIAILGGTGRQGRGLAYRLAAAGHSVRIGSRSIERADQTAGAIRQRDVPAPVTGWTNTDAAAACDIAILAIPYGGHLDVLMSVRDTLTGKIVISCVNPLSYDQHGARPLPVPYGSVAEEAAAVVPAAKVVGAFHHLSAAKLWRAGASLSNEDVLICGDDLDAKHVVITLAGAVTGRPGIDVGPLRMAAALEAFASVLLNINKRYKAQSGIAIVGVPNPEGGAPHDRSHVALRGPSDNAAG